MKSTPNPNKFSSRNSLAFINIIDYQEYYLIKENIIYKVLIGKNENQILIKCKDYMIDLTENDVSILIQEEMKSLDKAYEFIINIFEENKVIIKHIIIYKELKLSIINKEKQKEIELRLSYNINKNQNFIFNEIKILKSQIGELKNQINALKKENIELKNKIDEFKKGNENENENKNNKNNEVNKIELLTDLVNDSYAYSNNDNSFCIFKSINNIIYLIYSTYNKSLICYDINKQRKINQLRNYHKEQITNFRHFLDKQRKRDLIMSISAQDNNIKILNLNTWETCLDIININKVGLIYSACFLNENKKNYIITSNRSKEGNSEPIKIYNFDGEKILEINNSNESTLFIDIYYDEKTSNNYILTGNIGYAKSYCYNTNTLYHKYHDNESISNYGHFSLIINKNIEKIQLIESCIDGNIRIWDFHSGKLLNKIKIKEGGLRGICLWDNNFLFVGCDDHTIKLIDIKREIITNSIYGHNNKVITVKKIIHPKFGECIISQNWEKSQIKLWIYKK